MIHASSFPIDLPHAVLDSLPNPVFVKTAQSKFVWVNPAFERFFETTQANVLDTDGMRFIPARRGIEGGGETDIFQNGATEEVHQTVFTAQGHPRETLIRKSRMQLPDGQSYMIGVLHDVSDVMRANALLREDRSQLEQHAEHLRTIADRDPLTGAFTRRALFERVSQLGGMGYGLMLMDIDHFKQINDTHGHATGDAALAHFSCAVRGCIRSDDVFARIGGEELPSFCRVVTKST